MKISTGLKVLTLAALIAAGNGQIEARRHHRCGGRPPRVVVHVPASRPAVTAYRLDWIFGHTRNSSGIENPETDCKILESVQFYSLDGRPLSESPFKGFYIEHLRYNDSSIATVKRLK